jgi:hypothetical protein
LIKSKKLCPSLWCIKIEMCGLSLCKSIN